jgi:hypothetical protein
MYRVPLALDVKVIQNPLRTFHYTLAILHINKKNNQASSGRLQRPRLGTTEGVAALYAGMVNVERHLLTFVGAGHCVAAPIPAPAETRVVMVVKFIFTNPHYLVYVS